ncbi:MAG: methyltransferase domain-containing protein [Clostridia bacterium]|nr:methyltransferase domain-containing protein [Clostridia bacterium]
MEDVTVAALDLRNELSRDIIEKMLVCPVCKEGFGVSDDGRSLVCTSGHCFDGGAGGYVSLVRNGGGGDSKEAVRARKSFLGKGYYAPAADALCKIAEELVPSGGLLVDAGCGEGYYSNKLAEQGFLVFGADISKFAADSAAKGARQSRVARNATESSTLFSVASVFDLPLRDGCADCVVNIFAPCCAEEYARVLKRDGVLIVAAAGKDHLLEMKQVIYDDAYLNDTRKDLPTEEYFELCECRNSSFEITATGKEDIESLFSMTPYYWRTSTDGKARLSACDTLRTRVSFDFFIYKRK